MSRKTTEERTDDDRVDERVVRMKMYACENCRAIVGTVVSECPACGEEEPNMQRVLPEEKIPFTGLFE